MGRVAEKSENRGKSREVLVARAMFDPDVFKMRIWIFTKATNQSRVAETWRIHLPESMVREVWSLCHQSNTDGHRGVEGRLNKFLKGCFVLTTR